MGKIYIIANTLPSDFFIHAATADKALAKKIYAKMSKKWRGTHYEDDLEILEFSDEDALSLLEQV